MKQQSPTKKSIYRKLRHFALCLLIPLLSACNSKSADSQYSAQTKVSPTGQDVLFEDSMHDNWEQNWFLDGQMGTVKHWNGGLYLAGGPITKWGERAFGVEEPTEYNAYHVVLWTKQSFEGDIRVSYEFIKQPSSEGANLLYIQAQGIGVKPYVKDIYKWKDLREIPAMNMYFNYMNLISLSLREDIRCRRYPWKNMETGIDYENRGLFEPMLEHKGIPVGTTLYLEVEKRKKSLQLLLQNQETGEVIVDYTWDLSENLENRDPPYVDNGRIGIRLMGGHKLLFKNFKVERL